MDALQQIIHTLTPSEKRYFGMFATAFKTESGLVKLFNLMAEKKEYDENELSKKAGIKNIAEARSRLRGLLLKAMRNYREDAGAKHKLRDALNDIDFLMAKGLDDEARKEINKAWKIAEENEVYKDQAEMLDRLNYINQRTLKYNGSEESFDALCAQMDEVNEKQHEVYMALLHNRYISFLMATHQYIPASASGIDLKRIIAGINLRLKKAQSTYGQCVLLITSASCYQAVGDMEKTLEQYSRVRALFKKHPSLIKVSPTSYLSFVFNYNNISYSLEPVMAFSLIQQAEESFSLLKDFFRASPQKLIYYRYRLCVIKLSYAKANKQWHMLDKLEAEVSQNINGNDAPEKVIVALQTAGLISCFYELKKYEKALEWVQIYYQLDDPKVLKPLMTCVRVLEAFSYFGNKQYDISQTRCTNLYKTFIEQKLTGKYYIHLGTLLRKLNHWKPENVVHRKEIKELSAQLLELKETGDNDYHEQSEYYDTIDILEGLISKQGK